MKNIILSLLLFSAVKIFAIGPWVNPKGSLYTQISYTFLRYNTGFSLDLPETEFVSDYTLASYTEYSLNRKTALQLMIPYKFVGYQNTNTSGLGDIELSGKTELIKINGAPFTMYYNMIFPTSSRGDVVNNSDTTSYQLNTGIDRIGFEGGFSTGIGSDTYYALASVGYKIRNSIKDQLMYQIEASKAFHIADKKGYIGLSLTGAIVTSASTGTDVADTRVENYALLYDYETSYASPGLKASYNFHGNLWASLTAQGAFYATYAAASPTITVGLAYKLDREE